MPSIIKIVPLNKISSDYSLDNAPKNGLIIANPYFRPEDVMFAHRKFDVVTIKSFDVCAIIDHNFVHVKCFFRNKNFK